MQHPGSQPPPWQQPPTHNPYGAASPYGGPATAPPGPPQPHGGYQPAPAEQPGFYQGYRLANWGARVGASLIDSLVMVPLMVIGYAAAFIVGVSTVPAQPDLYGGTTSTALTFSPVAVVILLLCYLVALGLGIYNSVFRQGKTGQSWGKQALKLKLVTTKDGRPMGAGMVFVRNIVHIVDGLPFFPLCVGYLFPLWDPMRQTFADKICSSVVLADVPPTGR